MSQARRTFNLADIFSTVAEVHPTRCAFVCGAQRLSFGELDERATRLASALRAQGVKRGDNVGLQLHNSAAYLESFFACCKIGAVPANVNYRYVADELRQLFVSLDLRALIYSAECAAEVGKLGQDVPTLRLRVQVGQEEGAGVGADVGEDVGSGGGEAATAVLDYERLLASGSLPLHDPERSDQDLMLLCTGGTTGLPKGVLWPHKNLFMGALGGGGMYFRRGPVQSLEELAALVAQAPEVRYFALAPMMHGAALWASLISLYAGQTVVVNDQARFDPEHVWQITQDQGVNILSGVGDAMALPLVQALERHPGRWNLQRVMVYGNGGAPLSAHVAERLKAALPQLMISNGMGSSEGGYMGGGDKAAEGEALVLLAPRPDMALVDEARRLLTAPGSHGVLARTGHTPVGYYGDALKSAQTFVTIEGRLWVLTGDQARIDEQGRYVLLGRGSQCINTGGEKVFPEEVEQAVLRYAAVQDVIVVGMPDERWGQRVTAVVELAPGAEFSAQELARICREHLAGYKTPRSVHIAAKVQRSPAGKADYRWAASYAAGSTSVI